MYLALVQNCHASRVTYLIGLSYLGKIKVALLASRVKCKIVINKKELVTFTSLENASNLHAHKGDTIMFV